jgi:glycosyltransferase involved in cell wall biosynthesis
LSCSIAICTYNRPVELIECVKSVVIAAQYAALNNLELIIIDDGRLLDESFSNIKKLTEQNAIRFKYYSKKERNLYLSRKKAIELSSNEIILFLDDDVEIERNYLKVLEEAFSQQIGGFSGISKFATKPTIRMLLYQFIFLHSSFKPGNLSITGLNGSVTRWPIQKSSFRANFLIGCNMAYRKKFLTDLPMNLWFENYSIGEDIFISFFVAKKARLLVDPKALVIHKQSPNSREEYGKVSKSLIINNYYQLKYISNSRFKLILFYWSSIGYLIKDIYDFVLYSVRGRHDLAPIRWREFSSKLRGLKQILSKPYKNTIYGN